VIFLCILSFDGSKRKYVNPYRLILLSWLLIISFACTKETNQRKYSQNDHSHRTRPALPGVLASHRTKQETAWNISSRETVPAECALFWDTHRAFVVADETTDFAFVWSSCEKISGVGVSEIDKTNIILSPNPVQSKLHIQMDSGINSIAIFDISGVKAFEKTGTQKSTETIDVSSLPDGLYFLVVTGNDGQKITEKLVKAEF
jgi:hypothetical protein